MNPLILITGGLGDIGAAIARKFAANGWNVVVNDILPVKEGFARLRELVPSENLPKDTSLGRFSDGTSSRRRANPSLTGRISFTTTFQPFAANLRAMAAPMSPRPPVMRIRGFILHL